jgi:hypothetical protein
VGRQSAPVSNAPVTAVSVPTPQPVAFVTPIQPPTAFPSSTPSSSPAPTAKGGLSERAAPADAQTKQPPPEAKRKVETALTAAAIAAIIVQASRAQYHAGEGPALVRMTRCETAERAARGARTHDRAVLRRFAIRAT